MNRNRWMILAGVSAGFLVGIVLGLFMLLLPGCAATTPAPAPTVVKCLRAPHYTLAQEQAIGAELATLAAADPVALAMGDYTRLLDADAACNAAQAAPAAPAPK